MCYGELISDAMVKARKAHRCGACGKPIHPGKTYYKQTQRGDDGLETWKEHARCRALDYASDAFDGDGCLIDPREHLHETARLDGWRKLLADARKQLGLLLKSNGA